MAESLSPCRLKQALSEFNLRCCADFLGKPVVQVTEEEAVAHFVANSPPASIMCCEDCPCHHGEGEDLDAPTVKEMLLEQIKRHKSGANHTPQS